ncbi:MULTISPECIES: hypothetical protein [Chelativorans]|jgi:hypothetical protein|uniref:Spore coat protein U domain-containing protein n=1 Tax=Chelativorans sp. (strain BNC1) TaxID=266779 RepID=Q11IS5_CHESB|nr:MULTISPECIES: hypothetical protein [Chelativorans]
MKKLFVAAVITAATMSNAEAATATMPFSSTVSATCNIAIDSAGIMTPSSDQTQLSSQEQGGSAGLATITTTGASFDVTASAPTAFSAAPAGGETNVTFASLYSATGATTATDVAGATPTALGTGVTNLAVDLTATKSTGIFPEGNYSADVTITCE